MSPTRIKLSSTTSERHVYRHNLLRRRLCGFSNPIVSLPSRPMIEVNNPFYYVRGLNKSFLRGASHDLSVDWNILST
jgi:hypothetical protein